MHTVEARVTRKALAWAVGMTVALYALLWAASAPTSGPTPPHEPVLAQSAGQAGANGSNR